MPDLTEKGKLRRDQIIASADHLLRTYGYEDMTLRMLAQEVGISRGHLGHYFKEKKDLLFELTEVTINNLWTGSIELCSEWNNPYITYAFAVHWFFLICSELSDIKKIMFQALKHWDIQRAFSQMFVDHFIQFLQKNKNDFDIEKLEIFVQMSFAAQFNYICCYENTLTDDVSAVGSDLHIQTLFMLLGFQQDESERINKLVRSRIIDLSVKRLLVPFQYDYNWYRVANHQFRV